MAAVSGGHFNEAAAVAADPGKGIPGDGDRASAAGNAEALSADPMTVDSDAGFLAGERLAATGRDLAPDSGSPRDARAAARPRGLSVLVGSDDPFTRHAFRMGASAPGIKVLGAGTLASVTEEMAAEFAPDVVLLDVQTSAAEALYAIQRISARVPGTRILACSAPAGNEFGLLCLSAGAWGYISKEIDLGLLPRLLQALVLGEAVIPRALGTELVRRLVRSSPAASKATVALTPPERRLLELLRTGQTLAQAALELRITLATARRHFGSARRKLATRQVPIESDTGGGSSRQRNNFPEVP